MDFKEMESRAIEVRKIYAKLEHIKYGKKWSSAQIAQGFVGDVGDLIKLILVKSEVRDIENVDEKLAHELSDCLWSIIVLANEYNVDLENEFLNTMNILEEKISKDIK